MNPTRCSLEEYMAYQVVSPDRCTCTGAARYQLPEERLAIMTQLTCSVLILGSRLLTARSNMEGSRWRQKIRPCFPASMKGSTG